MFVVVDRSGLQVVFEQLEALLDAPQLVVGADDELRGLSSEASGVPPTTTATAPARRRAFGVWVAATLAGGALLGLIGWSVARDLSGPATTAARNLHTCQWTSETARGRTGKLLSGGQ